MICTSSQRGGIFTRAIISMPQKLLNSMITRSGLCSAASCFSFRLVNSSGLSK